MESACRTANRELTPEEHQRFFTAQGPFDRLLGLGSRRPACAGVN
jgi:hypothetical protein